MTEARKAHKVLKGKPTMEGAGVHLKRVFGFSEAPLFDPFLLLGSGCFPSLGGSSLKSQCMGT